MLYVLLLLSGIYIGGTILSVLDVYLRNVAEVLGDEVGREIEHEAYWHSFSWPLGAISMFVMGRKKAGEVLGFDHDRRRLRRMFEEQERSIEKLVAEANTKLASATEYSNSVYKSLLEQSDRLIALADVGMQCTTCAGSVVAVLGADVADVANVVKEISSRRKTDALKRHDTNVHYEQHREFYDELSEETKHATHVRCYARLDPDVGCRERAVYAGPGDAIPMMCEAHREDDSVLVGEMRMDERPHIVRGVREEP